MKLTGKAKEEFKNYFDENYRYNWNYYKAKKTLLNALIIEWFDTVGISINLEPIIDFKQKCLYFRPSVNLIYIKELRGISFKIRNEATDKAIAKANEIYNKNL